MSEDRNAPVLFNSLDLHAASQSALIARALAAPVPETVEEIAAFRAIEDKRQKMAVAQGMLSRLTIRRQQLLDVLESRGLNDHHYFRALLEADYDELARMGLDARYAWLDDVLAALISGGPFVEIQAATCYASPHLKRDGSLSFDYSSIPLEEQAGILLSSMFRELSHGCANVRLVIDVDDIHNYSTGDHISMAERDQFVIELSKILTEQGVHLPYDIPGKNYLILRRSEIIDEVDSMISNLRLSGQGTVERTDQGDVIFRPHTTLLRRLSLNQPDQERELKRSGIMLKRNGQATSAAISAASFLSPLNRNILHVVMCDKRLCIEQVRVYTLLRAMGVVTQDRYHNVFFDPERLSPEAIAFGVCDLIIDSLERFLRVLRLYDDWEDFEASEYMNRNYSEMILEDREIIQFVVDRLEKADLPQDGFRCAVDIGTGPNLYPAMLLAPYIQEGGSLELIEYSSTNRDFLKKMLEDHENDEIWKHFEAAMVSRGGNKYRGALERAKSLATISAGSIFELPREHYDAVTSYFVSESITISRREFRQALLSLVSSVKEGGVIIVAHMVGSLGWYAGKGTRFPSLRLDMDDLEEVYSSLDVTFEMHVVDGADDKIRDGYHGMAVVVARKRTLGLHEDEPVVVTLTSDDNDTVSSNP